MYRALSRSHRRDRQQQLLLAVNNEVMDVQASNNSNAAEGDSDVTGDNTAMATNASRVVDTRLSSQAVQRPEMLDPEAVLVRATTVVASEVEAGAAAAMNRTVTFALCTGFLILVASLVSVFVWYGVIADPGEILRKASVRAAGGSANAVMPAANGSTRATAPEIVQYLGVPQTFLPDDWNGSNHASFLPIANPPFSTSIGRLGELALEENDTDNTALPAPL